MKLLRIILTNVKFIRMKDPVRDSQLRVEAKLLVNYG